MSKHRIYRLKLGSWRLYLTNCRMKKMNPSNAARRSGNVSTAITAYKNRHYKLNGGVCDMCGKKVHRDEIQLHHVLPFYEFPQYGTNPSNMELVCSDCHHALHLNPYANLKHMEQKAQHFGFNLQEYFNEKKRT